MEKFTAVIDRIENGIALCVRDSDGAVFEIKGAGGFCENEKVVVTLDPRGALMEKAKETEEMKESNKERLRRLFDKNNKDG